MSSEFVHTVVTIVLATSFIVSSALVGLTSRQKVKALTEKKWRTAALYDTVERLCVGMACAMFVVLLLDIDHQSVMDHLFVLESKLEVLIR